MQRLAISVDTMTCDRRTVVSYFLASDCLVIEITLIKIENFTSGIVVSGHFWEMFLVGSVEYKFYYFVVDNVPNYYPSGCGWQEVSLKFL